MALTTDHEAKKEELQVSFSINLRAAILGIQVPVGPNMSE
jgi:hypothetical protein